MLNLKVCNVRGNPLLPDKSMFASVLCLHSSIQAVSLYYLESDRKPDGYPSREQLSTYTHLSKKDKMIHRWIKNRIAS